MGTRRAVAETVRQGPPAPKAMDSVPLRQPSVLLAANVGGSSRRPDLTRSRLSVHFCIGPRDVPAMMPSAEGSGVPCPTRRWRRPGRLLRGRAGRNGPSCGCPPLDGLRVRSWHDAGRDRRAARYRRGRCRKRPASPRTTARHMTSGEWPAAAATPMPVTTTARSSAMAAELLRNQDAVSGTTSAIDGKPSMMG